MTLTTFATERIMFLGDSITFSGEYITRLSIAIKQDPRYADAQIVNLAIPSETVSGLSEPGHANGRFPRPNVYERLDRVLAAFQPTLVFICYGNTDAISLPLQEGRFRAYRRGMSKIKTAIEAIGAKPFFLEPTLSEKGSYSDVMFTYAAWLNSLNGTRGWHIIPYRKILIDAIATQHKTQPNFRITNDGTHPTSMGYHMMAQAMWPAIRKALTITTLSETLPSPLPPETFTQANQQMIATRNLWLNKTKHSRPNCSGFVKGQPSQPVLPAITKTDTWSGGTRSHFTVAGRAAFFIAPTKPAPGNPWIWRTEFFDFRPQINQALLKAGWGVGYVKMSDLYGSPRALHIMDQYYDAVIGLFKVNPKVTLEGISRGGLYAFNWAVANPDQILAIYGYVPVCDMKSWPLKQSKKCWRQAKVCYRWQNDAQAMTYPYNPVDTAIYLAQAKIPIIAVLGQDDTIVPVKDNFNRIEAIYHEQSAPLKVIRIQGGNHHPKIKDPTPIMNFLQKIAAQHTTPIPCPLTHDKGI